MSHQSDAADGLEPLFTLGPLADQPDLVDRIEAELERRDGSLDYLAAIPHFAADLPARTSADLADLSPERLPLEVHLRTLDRLQTARASAPLLAPSPATAVPVLGRLWSMIRRQMHSLILFYVNRDGAYQSEVNAHLLRAVDHLSRLVAAQAAEIERLKVAAQEKEDASDGR